MFQARSDMQVVSGDLFSPHLQRILAAGGGGLDVNGEGVVRLENVDRDSGEILAQFRKWCKQQGGLGKIYKRLDKEKQSKVRRAVESRGTLPIFQ